MGFIIYEDLCLIDKGSYIEQRLKYNTRVLNSGYHNREEPHLPFNTQYLLRYHIITSQGTWYGHGT